jgi:cell division protein FtsI (penicillin-binding protein 3)
MEKTQAANGTVVVQDAHTGQILALAVRPTFNPNQFRHFATTDPALLNDHAITAVYEPGSTFKLVTYSAAMDQKVATPDDIVDCQGGQINLNGRIIHDDKSDRGMGKVTVATALAKSSDVAAVKLALKVGPDRFYQYIRDFGFGSRSGVELPGEVHGLLKPVKRWNSTSIGSIAIGQEVAVTPLQLVTMVSTIANGGVYLPPHVVLPESQLTPNSNQKSAPPQVAQVAQPVKTGEDLPNPLPEGAHRVISTMAAAEMRKMMEGVVLFGTGKQAQLNGYSSAGKTGTAQKIVQPAVPPGFKGPRPPATYSKTLHIASFAGFAPVNNPVISVAVVLDSPKGEYYGAAVSAPVFAEVAQQVLEYLRVPHDTEVRPSRAPAKNDTRVAEDDANTSDENIQALYEAANDLPSDDPLHGLPAAPGAPAPQQSSASAAATPPHASPPNQQPAKPSPPQTNTVVLSSAGQVRVPSLVGLPVRKIIVQAAAAGFEVQIVGSGTAREQVPAAGTMVPPSTKIVVRCGR